MGILQDLSLNQVHVQYQFTANYNINTYDIQYFVMRYIMEFVQITKFNCFVNVSK